MSSLPPRPGADPRWQEVDDEPSLGDLERKLNTRSWVGAIAAVLALAAGIVAIAIALDARDNSVDSGDIRRLQREISRVAETTTDSGDAEATQQAIDALSGRLDEIADALEGIDAADSATAERLDAIDAALEDLAERITTLEQEPAPEPDPLDEGT